MVWVFGEILGMDEVVTRAWSPMEQGMDLAFISGWTSCDDKQISSPIARTVLYSSRQRGFSIRLLRLFRLLCSLEPKFFQGGPRLGAWVFGCIPWSFILFENISERDNTMLWSPAHNFRFEVKSYYNTLQSGESSPFPWKSIWKV